MKEWWISAVVLLPAACWAQAKSREDVRVGVLGLFHPGQYGLSTLPGKPLECMDGDKRWPVSDHLQLLLAESRIKIVAGTRASLAESITCGDGQGGQTEFVVTVPGKISRHYVGKVEINPQPRELLVIVGMDLETAVASVVAAESSPQAPLEALKAQSVATRSFFVAGEGGHRCICFCGTAPCAVFRGPPRPRNTALPTPPPQHGVVAA